MGAPLITDWVQTAIAVAGFLMAVAGLIWQALSQREARTQRIQVEAINRGSGVWTILIRFAERDRSQKLKARVQVLHTEGAGLLHPIFAPAERSQFNEQIVRWDQADRGKAKTNLMVPLAHGSSPSEASGEVLAVVPDWTLSLGLKITVEETARRRSRATRTMVINPTV